MADQKLTALTEDTAPASTDYAYTVKDPAGTPLSRRSTWLNILKGQILGLLTSDNDIIVRIGGVATRVNIAASRIVGRKSSGDVVALTGAEAGDIIGVYQNYTPVPSQNGTKTTSAATGRYMQIGKFVHYFGTLTLSQAGTSGQPVTVSLPVTATSTPSANYQVGVGEINRSGTAYRALVVSLSSTTSIRFFRDAVTDGNELGVNPAFALASGNTINWNVTYEAA